jgi:hypothetical protein
MKMEIAKGNIPKTILSFELVLYINIMQITPILKFKVPTKLKNRSSESLRLWIVYLRINAIIAKRELVRISNIE